MYEFNDNDDDDDYAHRRNSYNTSTRISIASSSFAPGISNTNLVESSNDTIIKEDGTVSQNSLFDGISCSQRQHKHNNFSGSSLLEQRLGGIEEESEPSLEVDDYGRIVRSVRSSGSGVATATAATRSDGSGGHDLSSSSRYYASPRTLHSNFSAREREQLRRLQMTNSFHNSSSRAGSHYQNSGDDSHYSYPREDGGRMRGRDPSVAESVHNLPPPPTAAALSAGSAAPEHTPENNSYQSYYCEDDPDDNNSNNNSYYDGSTISGSGTYAGTLSASTITFDNHSYTSSKLTRRAVIPPVVKIPSASSKKQKGSKIIISNLSKKNDMEVIHESIEDRSYHEPMNASSPGRGGERKFEEWERGESHRHHSIGGMRQSSERSRLFDDEDSPRSQKISTEQLLDRRNAGRYDPPSEDEEEALEVPIEEEEEVVTKFRPPLRKPHDARSREIMVGRGKSTSLSVKSKSTTSPSRKKSPGRSTSRSYPRSRSRSRSSGPSSNRWNDVQSRSTSRSGQTLDKKSSSSSESSRRSIIEDRLSRLKEVQSRASSTNRSRSLMEDRSSRSNCMQSKSSRSGKTSGGRRMSPSSLSRNRIRDASSRSRSPASKRDYYDYEEEEEGSIRYGRRRQRSWDNSDGYDEDYEEYGLSSSGRYSRNRVEDAPSYYSGGGGASVRSYSTHGSPRDIDEEGYCMHHPNVRLMKLRNDDTWRVLRKRCPECLNDRRGRPRSYSGSAKDNQTTLSSDSVDSSSVPSFDPFNGMGFTFQMPEEREAEEATNRLKRRLAARAYHFPGNSWCQDWMQYISNTHTVLGLFFHHPLHPMGFQERLVMLFGSIAIGLTISNFTYMYFIRNGYSVKDNVFSITLKGVPEVGITKLMLVLWTLGSFLHTVFDLLLWHLKACTVCRYRGRIDDRLMKWGRVVGLFIVMVTIGAGGYAVLLRASIEYDGEGSVASEVEESILSNELYEIQYDDKRSFGFLFGYLIEFLLALFVYYPIAITILFSGVLGCSGRVPILGGRPREMKKEQRYELSKRRPRILKAGKASEENQIV